MSETWWVAHNGQAVGPFSLEDLKARASEGELTPQTLVWKPGMPDWGFAHAATQLFGDSTPKALAPQENTPPAHASDVRSLEVQKQGLSRRPKEKSPSVLFGSLHTRDAAQQAVKAGAFSGYALAAMQVLGAIFIYATGFNAVTKESFAGEALAGQLSIYVGAAVLAAALSFWFQRKPRVVIPLLLGLWFVAEVAMKIAYGQAPNVGWLIFYIAIAAGFVAGIRGAIFLRRVENLEKAEQEALLAAAAPTALPSTLAELYAPQKPSPGSVIARHWRGELSLPVSYWVIGVGSGFTVLVLGVAFEQAINYADLGPKGSGAVLLVFLAALLILTTWQLVGIWRSAGVHFRTKSKLWGSLARVAVLLGIVQVVSQFQIYGPMAAESARLAFLGDDTPRHQLRLLRGGTELELSGGLSEGTADALKNVLDAGPGIQIVHLNSIGGLLGEGYKINKLLSERKLATYTSTECVSACTIAFLGGASRYLSPNAKLGFHSARFGSLDGTSELDLNTEMATTLRDRGAPGWFIKKAFDTPPSDMWYPTHAELLGAGVVTEIVDANQFALSGTGGIWRDSSATRGTLEKALESFPLLSVLKESEPEAHNKMLTMMTRGITEGRAVVDVQQDISKNIMDEMLPKYLKYGRGNELLAYWRVQIDEMQYLQRTDPGKCLAFMFPELRPPTWDMTRVLPKELGQADLAALSSLIAAGTDANKASYTPPTDSEFVAMFVGAEKLVPGATSIIENPKQHLDQPKRVCDAFIAFYSQVLALPPKRADAVFRSFAMSE